MEQRRFGDSDLKCSALGFGTWELSTTDYGEIDVKEAQRAAQEAIDHGITLFDTAEAYGPCARHLGITRRSCSARRSGAGARRSCW